MTSTSAIVQLAKLGPELTFNRAIADVKVGYAESFKRIAAARGNATKWKALTDEERELSALIERSIVIANFLGDAI